MARGGSRLVYVLLGMLLACTLIATTLLVISRMRTGSWKLPTGDDLIWVADVITGNKRPSRIIYLHRDPITLTGGRDASHLNRSSVITATGRAEVKMPGFQSSNKRRWGEIVACVRKQFAPFDVAVTDKRPDAPGYIMVVVGGHPEDIGHKSHHVSGLAPFNSQVIPDAVVFAFSRALGNRARAVCETIAMEVAHAYGLDHAFYCKDVMTYKSGCGAKSFVDKDVRCGESRARDCANKAPTQNSYRYLMQVLGPAQKPAAQKPAAKKK